VGVEGDSVDDGGDQAWVGEDGAPFAEGQVGRDRDGCSFLPFGNDLEGQFGAAWVDLDVAELVEAKRSRRPYRPTTLDRTRSSAASTSSFTSCAVEV
jgi:hypothetical protein